MKYLYKPTLTIAIFTFVAALILSLINNLTYPKIIKIAKQKETATLSKVLPGFKIDAQRDKKTIHIDKQKITYWTIQKTSNNQTRHGFAFVATSKGYSGDIKTMIGIDDLYEIQGISILSQTETPGLGARCEEIASKKTFWDFITGKKVAGEPTTPWFQEQFKGLKSNQTINIVKKGDWEPSMKRKLLKNNSVSAITGATITTSAVKNGIEKYTNIFKPIIEKVKQQVENNQ
jgi:electron transport complex protein RnfG